MRFKALVVRSKSEQMIYFDIKSNQNRDEKEVPEEIMKKAAELHDELNKWRNS